MPKTKAQIAKEEAKIAELEAQGLSRSDAQGALEAAELIRNANKKEKMTKKTSKKPLKPVFSILVGDALDSLTDGSGLDLEREKIMRLCDAAPELLSLAEDLLWHLEQDARNASKSCEDDTVDAINKDLANATAIVKRARGETLRPKATAKLSAADSIRYAIWNLEQGRSDDALIVLRQAAIAL